MVVDMATASFSPPAALSHSAGREGYLEVHGEGDALTGRYDVSNQDGHATVVLRIETTGAIQLNASIPECGATPYIDRYHPAIPLETPVTIVGE